MDIPIYDQLCEERGFDPIYPHFRMRIIANAGAWRSALRLAVEVGGVEQDPTKPIFVRPKPAPAEEFIETLPEGWTQLGYVSDDGIQVEWRDPEPRTVEQQQDAVRKLGQILPLTPYEEAMRQYARELAAVTEIPPLTLEPETSTSSDYLRELTPRDPQKDGEIATCARCGKPLIGWLYTAWNGMEYDLLDAGWSHDTHPEDDHDGIAL